MICLDIPCGSRLETARRTVPLPQVSKVTDSQQFSKNIAAPMQKTSRSEPVFSQAPLLADFRELARRTGFRGGHLKACGAFLPMPCHRSCPDRAAGT
jgi:hypothetical protein